MIGNLTKPPATPSEPPTSDARADLKDAVSARENARSALSDAREATGRVQAIIDGVQPAEAEAKRAAKAASDVTKNWALNGARRDMPASDQMLLDQAAHAEQAAQQARLWSDGARAALHQVKAFEEDATYALESASSEVRNAIQRVLTARIESDFADIERAYQASAAAESRIRALAHVLRFGRHHGLPGSGGVELLQRLEDVRRAKVPSEEELRELAHPWIDFAKRLARDPDAPGP
jgi:hypothetical protein